MDNAEIDVLIKSLAVINQRLKRLEEVLEKITSDNHVHYHFENHNYLAEEENPDYYN